MTQDVLAARIDGLVQAMYLEEKLRQLTMIRASFGDVGPEPRGPVAVQIFRLNANNSGKKHFAKSGADCITPLRCNSGLQRSASAYPIARAR